MRKFNRDTISHYCHHSLRSVSIFWYSYWARISTYWWNIDVGPNSKFAGLMKFYRYPNSQIKIGANCRFSSTSTSNLIGINRPCIFSTLNPDAQIIIGNKCGFSGTVIGAASQITLGSNVRCGANTTITDTDWHLDDPRSNEPQPIHIGDSVWLGMNVTILKGVTIGKGSFIGANSLVTKSVPANVIAAGNPAKIIKKLNSLHCL